MIFYTVIFKLNTFDDDIIFDKIIAVDKENAECKAIQKFIWLYGAPATFCIEEIIVEEI